MDSFYVLLFMLLLYLFFWAIVDVFVASDISTKLMRIKTKIIFHTFSSPIIFGLLILFVILTENKAFSIYFGVGFIIGSLFRSFFGERKFLTNFNLENEQLEIKYLNSLLKEFSYSIKLADITIIEIEKEDWWIDYPASLKIKSNGKWNKIYLVDKNMKLIIQNNIEAANRQFGIMAADGNANGRTIYL